LELLTMNPPRSNVTWGAVTSIALVSIGFVRFPVRR
jgi:hypothetical protein